MNIYAQKPRKQKPWKDGELRLIMLHCGKRTLDDITNMVNKQFGNKRTPGSIEARGHKNGFNFRLRAAQ